MSDGRTVWLKKDADWWLRERVVELGEEFGTVGPGVLDWLECQAKKQNAGGFVKAGYKSCARGAFTDPVTVSHVVSRAVTLGALDDFEEDGPFFTCRISGWASDQKRGDAAVRQAAHRAKSSGSVTPSHGLSRAVTVSHLREEKRREEGEENKTPSNKGVDQDALPDDFPYDLVPMVESVLAVLKGVYDVRGGNLPTRRGVGLVLKAYPDHDHMTIAGELEHWATGTGKPVNRKDWVSTFRTFCSNKPPGKPQLRAVEGGKRFEGERDSSRFADAW